MKQAEPDLSATVPQPVVRVEDITKHFSVRQGLFGSIPLKAVDGVSFQIGAQETLGLVGESGSGKSTLARVIVQLQPATSGHVHFEGKDLTALRGETLRRMRQRMQMIFQDPYGSLNPRQTVGTIISQPLRNFGIGTRKEQEARVAEVMNECGLNPNFVGRYPHEFSGGQRQRVGIARALALRPTFIVADEPVSALDVSIQAQIVNLLEDLQQAHHLTYLFIAHDLSVVRHLSDRVAIMYLGKVVEIAPSGELYERPLHPYTKVLLSSIPIPDPDQEALREQARVEGEPPSPTNVPPGCRFHPRCPIAKFPICSTEEPPLVEKSRGRWAACHFAGEF
ncbi:MAG TPA: ABC transporter ATP-binding protein [Candidatus Dormibacteraeota bacterium]